MNGRNYNQKLSLLSDQALGEGNAFDVDGLAFKEYSNILSQAAKDTLGPFTIGVFGEWGTGKTSLLRLIEKDLKECDEVVTVWFNAWRYESEDQPVVPLVATITRELKRNKTFLRLLKDGGDCLVRSLKAIAYGFSLKSKFRMPGLAEVEASLNGKDIIDRDEKLSEDGFLDKSIYFESFQELSNIEVPDKARIVVIIDDLDRCLPDKAIRLLESIKLALSHPRFIFFIGVARKIIEEYLVHKYEMEYGIKGFNGYAYLDKIVQLPFHIPPHTNRMGQFWDSLISRLNEDDQKNLKELMPIISPVSGNNPRTAVRFINNILVDRAIYHATSNQKTVKNVPIGFFAVTRSLEQRWYELYLLLSKSSDICAELVKWVDGDIPDIESLVQTDHQDILKSLQSDEELRDLISSDHGRSWLEKTEERNVTIDFLHKERGENSFVGEGPVKLQYPRKIHKFVIESGEEYASFTVQFKFFLEENGYLCDLFRSDLPLSKVRWEIGPHLGNSVFIPIIDSNSKDHHFPFTKMLISSSLKNKIIPVLVGDKIQYEAYLDKSRINFLKFNKKDDINERELLNLIEHELEEKGYSL